MRESRPLSEPILQFSLLDEIARLAGEPQWSDGDRNSIVLARDEQFRVLLTVMRRGAQIADRDGTETLSLQLLSGSVMVRRDAADAVLAPGELVVLERGGAWSIDALEESAALFTLGETGVAGL